MSTKQEASRVHVYSKIPCLLNKKLHVYYQLRDSGRYTQSSVGSYMICCYLSVEGGNVCCSPFVIWVEIELSCVVTL